MIDRFRALSLPLRVVVGLVAAAIALAALLFVYDVLGTGFLDSGGSVG